MKTRNYFHCLSSGFAAALTLLLLLMPVGQAAAQPKSLEVEPGSKGELPTLPTPAPLEQGRFAGLWISDVGMTINSTNWFDRYVRFVITDPAYYEATACYIEYRPKVDGGGWTSWKTIESIGAVNLELSVKLSELPDYPAFDFRVTLADGPCGGYHSNEVSIVKPGNVATNYGYTWSEEPTIVGSTVGNNFDLDAHTYRYYDDAWNEDAVYTKADGYYRYKWYHRNPNTWEMTQIEGADQSSYTTTIDDAGYQLVMEITGDDEHCSLFFRYNFGEIVMPVQASLAYVGNDGFVLNTDYVVPADCFTYNNEFAYNWTEDMEIVHDEPLPDGVVSQRKPGQYVFRLPSDDYNGVIYDVNIPGAMLTFVYLAEWNDPPTPWYREAQVMSDRFMQALAVKTAFNNVPTAATIEIYAPNIDDELALFATAETDPESGSVYFDMLPTLGEGCYVKALRTATTTDTYYPNALLWTEATPVKPGMDEDWNALSVTIDLQRAFEPLTGTGIIEGTITLENTSQPAPRRASVGSADAPDVTVLLKQKGGDIIASEGITATGAYRFENVPLGSYEVLVNIDGCTMEDATEVTLTDDNPEASGIDYNVEENTIVPAGQPSDPTAITPAEVVYDATQSHPLYDLQGRMIGNPSTPNTLPPFVGRGTLYIRNGKKYIQQ